MEAIEPSKYNQLTLELPPLLMMELVNTCKIIKDVKDEMYLVKMGFRLFSIIRRAKNEVHEQAKATFITP